MRTTLITLALCLSAHLPLTAAPADHATEAERQLELARAALEEDDGEVALAAAELGLEYDLDHAGLLDIASRAAEELLMDDLAVRYALLGLKAHGSEDVAETLNARIAALCPSAVAADALLTDYTEQLFELGKLCSRRKLYVNACDFYTRVAGTPIEPQADKQLERLYKNKKATQAMIDSGLDVPFKPKRGLSAKQIAKQDKDHVQWEEAWELEGKGYTVHTNMGYVMAEDMLKAMEQINGFYRKVFNYRIRGGGTQRLNLYVYKSRTEFDIYEDGPDPGVKGFFVPGATTVHTYDPRTEGGSLASLWSTLFHEASHQFTRLVLPNSCPTWLNEGTASYFEGARLMDNGSIRTNLIPDGRLRNLKYMLGHDSARFPSLEEVVTFFRPGSYPGEYYPFGWGLVYFMRNFEDAECERIYIEPYLDFMLAYKGGERHDVLARFVEYFVDKVKDPEVKSFADFENRWTTWITRLADLHFGPAERADDLVARGRKQLEFKKLEAAAESFAWAARKRPGDSLPLFELAEAQARLKQKDASTYNMRRALEAARAHPPEDVLEGFAKSAGEVVEACFSGLTKQDKQLAGALEELDEAFATAVVKSAQEMHEKEFHSLALDLLQRTSTALGGPSAINKVIAEIKAKSKTDLRRWRRPEIEPDLAAWEPGDDWSSDGEKLTCSTDGASFLILSKPLDGDFRFEFEITVTGDLDTGTIGLLYGSDPRSDDLFMLDGHGIPLVWRRGEELQALENFSRSRVKLDGTPIQLAVEVKGSRIEYFIRDKSVGKRSGSPESLRGKIGIFCEDARIEVREIRLLE